MSFQRLEGTSAIRNGYGKYRTASENRGLTLQAQVLTDEYRHRDTVVVCDPLNCRLAFGQAEIRRQYGGEQLFVPRGFAHGFCTLEPDAVVAYKVDDFYSPANDSGLIWNDPTLAVDWPVGPEPAVLSDKDLKLGHFADFQSPFRYEA